MKAFFKSYGFILFWLIAMVDIVAISMHNYQIPFIAKPLLLPVLMATLFSSSNNSNRRWLIMTGLLFSFAGDVFLLFEESNSLFFIFGLASFLITHIFYILFFLSPKKTGRSLLIQKPFLILLVMIYSGALLFLLIPKLGALTVPVVLYAVILSVMFLCSLHVYNKISTAAGRLFITGAGFFVVSDSLLAINKFYTALPAAGFFIMITYCLAQYFIVKGFIKMQQSSSFA
ncbi:MAG: lysoplasmalogenase [Ferruginibacter sp.]